MAGRVFAIASQCRFSRTISAPSASSWSSRASSSPGPLRSHASSWMPKRIVPPCACGAGAAAAPADSASRQMRIRRVRDLGTVAASQVDGRRGRTVSTWCQRCLAASPAPKPRNARALLFQKRYPRVRIPSVPSLACPRKLQRRLRRRHVPRPRLPRPRRPGARRSSSRNCTSAQRAGERRFSSVVQLLEGPKGEQFVRIAYSTGGSVRRGPVTLRARDVERLHEALRTRPQLARALGLAGALGIEPGGDA